ncbi:unnamed protein product [Macrosiphum euphorbiae]|uniref:Uncharacterized protein n=1 Tax=Macrosiphum euphorbiae TaxID=13131 RepID=A0AAV0VNS3_9HEMI|nr:unnamed protein product [Macrosiphum euphorbiae]
MTSFSYGSGALTRRASGISTSVAFNPDNTSKCISHGKSADRTPGLRGDKLVFDQLSGIRWQQGNTGGMDKVVQWKIVSTGSNGSQLVDCSYVTSSCRSIID